MSALDYALAAGFPADLLLPIAPPKGKPGDTIRAGSMGKVPARLEGSTWQAISDWQNGVDPEWLHHCARAGANAGLRLGVRGSPVLAIDIDLESGHEAERETAVTAAAHWLIDEHVADAAVRSTVPHRAMLLIRLPVGADPGRKAQWHLSDAGGHPIGKIELLAHGQQVVIGGTHVSGSAIGWQPGGAVPRFFDIPELPDREAVLALVTAVLLALRSRHAVSVTSRSKTGVARTGGPRLFEDLAPPGAAEVVALLDHLPNPTTTDHQEWVSVMLAAKGCIDGLETQGRLADGDGNRIRDAACRWAARWPGSDGFEGEIEKWEADWSTRDAPLAGWGSLDRKAATRIPGYRHQRAAAEFAAASPDLDAMSGDPPGRPKSDQHWREMLLRGKPDKDGNPGPVRSILANAECAFRHAPEWAGRVAFDTFADKLVFRAAPPWVRPGAAFRTTPVHDVDLSRAATWLQREVGLAVSTEVVREALILVGSDAPVHPVRDYLAALPPAATRHLDTWLIDFLGAEDTRLNRAVGRAFLISAVARVMRPGCKVDTVLILEGRQSLKKSTALAALAGPWFIDHVPDFASKDAALQLQGVWIVEFAELDHLSRVEASTAKRFISTATDRFRRPYGRVTEDFPRQCVFAGTVNPGGAGYLADETGNRRYWPVMCGVGWPAARKVDEAGIRAARDALWSEAFAAFTAGEAWWLSDQDEVAQRAATADRAEVDSWTPIIAGYLDGRFEATAEEMLFLAVGKPTKDQTRQDAIRIGRIMTRLGWARERTEDGGRERWRYVAPAAWPRADATDFRAIAG